VGGHSFREFNTYADVLCRSSACIFRLHRGGYGGARGEWPLLLTLEVAFFTDYSGLQRFLVLRRFIAIRVFPRLVGGRRILGVTFLGWRACRRMNQCRTLRSTSSPSGSYCLEGAAELSCNLVVSRYIEKRCRIRILVLSRFMLLGVLHRLEDTP